MFIEIVMRSTVDLCFYVLKYPLTWQLMRMETAHQRQTCVLDREGLQSYENHQEKGKAVHNASSKISLVVRKMLLPLLDTPMHPHVVFDAETDQEELDLLEQMDRNRPQMLEDPKSFIQHLQSLIGRYHTYSSGYSRVSSNDETTNHHLKSKMFSTCSDSEISIHSPQTDLSASTASGTSVKSTGLAFTQSSDNVCIGYSSDHIIAPSLRQRHSVHSTVM
jgi:hypothetical protein